MIRKKTGFLLLCIFLILLTNPVYAKYKFFSFGDWKVVVTTDIFEKDDAFIWHTPRVKDGGSIAVRCKNGKYSIAIKQSNKIYWTETTSPVQYKIGPNGEIKQEQWIYDPAFNTTELENATSMIEKMKAAPGHFTVKSLADEFKPSLNGFTKAVNKLDEYCK